MEDVDLWLAVDVSRLVDTWYGNFELPADAPMRQPGEYDLELRDGRHGTVVVTKIQIAGGLKVGTFEGIGPLYEPVI